jgi:hypothetical protein
MQMIESPRQGRELVAAGIAVACGQAAADFLEHQDVEAGVESEHAFDDPVEVGRTGG